MWKNTWTTTKCETEEIKSRTDQVYKYKMVVGKKKKHLWLDKALITCIVRHLNRKWQEIRSSKYSNFVRKYRLLLTCNILHVNICSVLETCMFYTVCKSVNTFCFVSVSKKNCWKSISLLKKYNSQYLILFVTLKKHFIRTV